MGNYHQQSPYPNYRPGANYRNFALAGLALVAVIARALLARIVATARAELAFVAVVVAIAEFAELARFLITQTKLNAPRHILRP